MCNDTEKVTGTPPRRHKESKTTVKIEISKYKALISALGDSKKVIRLTFALFLLGVFLFVGITVVVLNVKRMYPYSDITTNGLGATTIRNEKSEISYWLFNTAEVWANSGITVKEGDILTIRASGKTHTAIHHLYDDAKNNKEITENWFGSEGREDDPNSSAFKRRMFRIFPNMNSGALLMQVAKGDEKVANTPRSSGANPDNFYYIGKERQNIYINQSGTLYFCINDIILDRKTINEMMYKCIIDEKGLSYRDMLKSRDNDMLSVFNDTFKDSYSNKRKIGKMELGYALLPVKDTIHKKGIVQLKDTSKRVCELEYYLKMGYEEAWFDDNVGSFLIVIEKTHGR